MIIISPYDPRWPLLFEAEAISIRSVVGSAALRIEHVGSTSVPGLAAKPIIDIQVSVASLEPASMYAELLARLGYTHIPVGPFDRVYPFFARPTVLSSTHHIHLCVQGQEQERRHLAFRDYLRFHPHVAAEYVELKKNLATKHHGTTLESRESYSLSKGEFVESVLIQAFSAGYPRPEAP